MPKASALSSHLRALALGSSPGLHRSPCLHPPGRTSKAWGLSSIAPQRLRLQHPISSGRARKRQVLPPFYALVRARTDPACISRPWFPGPPIVLLSIVADHRNTGARHLPQWASLQSYAVPAASFDSITNVAGRLAGLGKRKTTRDGYLYTHHWLRTGSQ